MLKEKSGSRETIDYSFAVTTAAAVSSNLGAVTGFIWGDSTFTNSK